MDDLYQSITDLMVNFKAIMHGWGIRIDKNVVRTVKGKL